MASFYQLVVDSVVIDSRESASASGSTITGAILGVGDRETGAIVTEGPDNLRFPFRVRVTAGSSADLMDAVQDVLDAIALIGRQGVQLLDETGEVCVDLDANAFERLEAETELSLAPDGAASGAVIECAVVAVKFDSDYTDGRTSWSYQRNSSGRAFCVGRVRGTSRAAVVAIAAGLRSGAIRPVWMPSDMIVVEDTAEFDARGITTNIGALAEADYRPGEEVVVFEQFPAWAAAIRTLGCKKLECRFVASPRAPLDSRAGNVTGLDVAITATMHFKTEYNSTYDSADQSSSVVAAADLPGKAVAAAAILVTQAQTRLGEGEFTLMSSIEKSVTGEDGVYTLAIAAITNGPNRVLSWDERDLYEETSQDEDLDIFDGSHWEFEHPGGPLCTIQHDLAISSIGGPRGYRSPVSLQRRPGRGKWKQKYQGDETPKILPTGGATQYLSVFKRNYKFIRSGSGGGGGGSDKTTTASQSPTGHVGQFG